MREKFKEDLRHIKDTYTGRDNKLKDELHKMRRRLDDPNIISPNIVNDMMVSFRDIQDYDAMVHLVEDLEKVPNRCNYTKNPQIFFLYVFALGKRGNEGDRDKAYNITTEAVEAMSEKEYRQTDPDLVGK